LITSLARATTASRRVAPDPKTVLSQFLFPSHPTADDKPRDYKYPVNALSGADGDDE